jgi:hypothetical protein
MGRAEPPAGDDAGRAVQVGRKQASMPSTNQVLLWAPRVLGIAAALFLAMFALDVIGEPGTVIEKSVALEYSPNPDQLKMMLKGIKVSTSGLV